MRRPGVPRRMLAITAANSLSDAGQGQFMFVLPWMLLALGHDPRDAALATAFVYVPLLVTAIPAGITGDNVPPLREHLGLDELAASAPFIAGMAVVVLLTLPVTRGVRRRLGPFPAFLAATSAGFRRPLLAR